MHRRRESLACADACCSCGTQPGTTWIHQQTPMSSKQCMRLHDSSVACMIPPGDLLIFLDDKLIKWPISVDEEQGVILACTLNEKGQPYLDEQKGEVAKHKMEEWWLGREETYLLSAF
jgi:hypothetical protein